MRASGGASLLTKLAIPLEAQALSDCCAPAILNVTVNLQALNRRPGKGHLAQCRRSFRRQSVPGCITADPVSNLKMIRTASRVQASPANDSCFVCDEQPLCPILI